VAFGSRWRRNQERAGSPNAPPAILRRDFQIAIVVFEKLQALLVGHPQLMKVVGLVVVDELQIITDRERGPTLELLLTKLRIATARPRIIGLSAVLGRAQTLADWLGARLLVETRRPVELRKGVLCRGAFRYIEHNSGKEGVEDFPDVRHERREELLLAAVEELIRRGDPVLAFVPDRGSTVQFARVLAQRVTAAVATQAIEELRQFEETHAREALLEVLGSGIAFHNSDLSPEERDLVERHFRSGAIRGLFSTSTLAVGMNLPVKNVVLDGRKWEYLRRYGRWSLEDVTKSEYENMSGRAGRLSLVNDFGRSILVTYSPFEAEVWLRHYAGSDFENIRPTLGDAPLEDHVLDVLASGLANTRDEVADLLLSSFTGQVHWAQKISRDEFTDALTRAVEVCVGAGLAEQKGDALEINVVGRACATKGIGAKTGIVLARWARGAAAVTLSELEVLTVASFTDGGDGVYVNLAKDERYRADYRAQLLARAAVAGVAARPVFADLAAQVNAAEYEAAKAIKKTLLLGDWIAELPTKELETSYHVWAGGCPAAPPREPESAEGAAREAARARGDRGFERCGGGSARGRGPGCWRITEARAAGQDGEDRQQGGPGGEGGLGAPMKVDTLEAYNVPPDIIEVWRNDVGTELLPVQERAVKEFGLFGSDNLIVFSPTSSGKTFIGEMAAVKAARENTKVFYLVPQKALAAEKFEELRRRYGPVGINVVVSSRDHREFDDQMDALIKALEARGHRVEITSPEPSPGPDQSGRRQAGRPSETRVKVGSELVSLHILEMIDDGRPSGRLCLSIEPVPAGWKVRNAWRDGKRPLERCLGDVVRGIITLARVLVQDETEQEGHRSEAQETERRKKVEWERYRLQERKLVDLQSRVLDHVQGEEIRSFLRAGEAYISVNGPVGPEAEIAAWMDWARGIAQTLQDNAIRTLLTYRPRPAE